MAMPFNPSYNQPINVSGQWTGSDPKTNNPQPKNHNMTLHAHLQKARTEEDVKDAYIRALGLKGYSKGLVDIQTDEIWFEAKINPTPIATMFAQLLFYVREAKDRGDHLPPFLAVVDREKAALMETRNALPVFSHKKIKWAKSASEMAGDKGKAAIALIKPFIEAHFTVYQIEHDADNFMAAVNNAINTGKIIRTPITPDNLKQVFDKWMMMVGAELEGVHEKDYALLFYADIMFDPTLGKTSVSDLPVRLLMDGEKPVFVLHQKNYDLTSANGHYRFWQLYHRPPDKAHRKYLLERRDILLPVDERVFKGEFFTPLHVVDKAYDLLTEVLGKNWQDNYIVWDPCCGVGNLETRHSNPRQIFMSTLEQRDLDLMRASHICSQAVKFQYDYLNDDINADGEIDYSLTKKMPPALRQAIAEANAKKKGAKKILILMNPPYAEATNANTVSGTGKNKGGVANTIFSQTAMAKYGKAGKELFTQFIARIYQEIPYATLAIFSKLKYINAPNFEEFRNQWQAEFKGGFIVHSKAFDGLSGNFPIGFLVWDTAKKQTITEINTKILDKNGEWLTGEKAFVNLPSNSYLNVWINRPRANNEKVIPLTNAVTPTNSVPRVSTWSNSAIAYMYCGVNDLQHAGQQTVLYSGVYHGGNGFYVNPENLWQAAIVYTVRKVVKHTWHNDRDQFLQPTGEMTDEFKNDCLIYMLFSGSNLTASADDLAWNGKKWSLVNHFIPFTEAEISAAGRFESNFMSDYLKARKLPKELSAEARAVFNEGKKCFIAFHQAINSKTFDKKTRNEYKLNREGKQDYGWYQCRKALEFHQVHNGEALHDFTAFKAAYTVLAEKLIPQVYALGFLK